MLRTLLFYVVLLPATALFSLGCILGGVLRWRKLTTSSEKLWGRVLMWAVGARVEADLDALPAAGPFVLVANHQSQVDIFLFFSLLRRFDLSFMAKESLFRIPLFGAAMRTAGHVPVDRKNQRQAMRALNEAAARVQEGFCPVVFPEGTRQSQVDVLGEFKTGGSILAIKSGAPIVPVVHHGAGNILQPRDWRLGASRLVRVKALAPIEPERFSLKQRDELTAYLQHVMGEAYQELRRVHQENVS